MISDNEILEQITELEHSQFCDWSKNLAEAEKISPERLERWQRHWKPYKQLSEREREVHRFYARKVVKLLQRIAEL